MQRPPVALIIRDLMHEKCLINELIIHDSFDHNVPNSYRELVLLTAFEQKCNGDAT